jgi:peptidoglycan/xylan/chitin deacetylase (PgdA/CDA1 family)
MKHLILSAMVVIAAGIFSSSARADGVAAAPAKTPIHVAFMIDDGPSANTLRILEVFKKQGVHVNFDLVGKNVEAHPDLVKAIAAGGHVICDHGYEHGHTKDYSDAAYEHEVAAGAEAIRKVTGKAPEWYWPPFLEVDPRLSAIAAKHGMKVCTFPYVVQINDFVTTVSAEQIRKNTVDGVRDGAVIILHEWRDASADEMETIIVQLRAKGCVFLTYPEFSKYIESVKK